MTLNIFQTRVVSRSNKELLKILDKPNDYHELFIEAVVDELKERKIDIPQHLIKKKIAKIPTGQRTEEANVKPLSNVPKDLKLLSPRNFSWLILYFICYTAILLILTLDYFDDSTYRTLIFLFPVLPLLYINSNTTPEKLRNDHFQVRIWLAVGFVLIVLLRSYVALIDILSIGQVLTAITTLIVFTGIYSFPIYKFRKKLSFIKVVSRKILFYLTIPSILIISSIVILQKKLFHPAGDAYQSWVGKAELNYHNFQGYQVLYTKYAAGINSDIILENDTMLKAVYYPKYTWMNWWDKGNSYLLLQHERYHFNITEMITRELRKELTVNDLHSSTSGFNKKIDEYRAKLNALQNLYDYETDHSIISDAQSLWQFRIDSTLIVYDRYFDIQPKSVQESNVKRFRFIEQIGDLKPIGRGMILPYEFHSGSYYKFKFNDNNLLTEINYLSNSASTKDPYYRAAIIRVDNKSLNSTRYSFYDENGDAVDNRFGFHQMIASETTDQLEYSYYDINGESTVGLTGEYSTFISRDEQGNILSKYFTNEKGKRISNVMNQYELRYSYKSRPKEIIVTNIDKNGRVIPDINGDEQYYYGYNEITGLERSYKKRSKSNVDQLTGVAIEEIIYDEVGYGVMQSFYDVDFNPTQKFNGVWRLINSRDRYGNLNMEATFNSNNLLINDDRGVAIKFWEFDSLGRITEYSEYDKGKVVLFDSDGIGKVRYQYDSLNRTVEICNLNGYDYPVKSDFFGPISYFEFDSIDNSRYSYFKDQDGTLCSTLLDFYSAKFIYDEQDNVVSTSYYDENGKLTEVQHDVAVFQYAYDSLGNKVETRYYRKDENPASANQGAHINRYVYDSLNRLVERSYYDTLEQLIEFEGHAKIKWAYDERGNNTEMRFYDELGRLGDSVAIVQMFYKDDRLVKEVKLDKHYQGVRNEPSIVNYEYDRGGNLAQESYYNFQNEPVHNKNGVHAKFHEYDKWKRNTKNYLLDSLFSLVEVEGVAASTFEYNKRGNLIELVRYNSRNQVSENSLGIAIEKYKYNASDELTQVMYYDQNANILSGRKVASIIYERNPSGYITLETFLDYRGYPVNKTDSIAQIAKEYNRNGSIVSTDSLSATEVFEKNPKIHPIE